MSENMLENRVTEARVSHDETRVSHDTRSFTDKLADEDRLVWGTSSSVWDGIKAGAHGMYEHLELAAATNKSE